MPINREIAELKDYCIDLRRYFHMHPELPLQEFNTASVIERELDSCGIEHFRVGETGVCGIIKGRKSGKILGIRADIDALPIQEINDVPYKSETDGVMHACGHDSHTAALLTTAQVLKKYSDFFDGEVRLFFQQAEEVGQGGRLFVKSGLMNGVDRVIGYHTSPLLSVGQVSCTAGPQNASCDHFKVTVKGKSSHIAHPEAGIDALYIACKTVLELQSLPSRLVCPVDSVVVAIGKLEAGTTYNIIAGEAVFEGTTRAFDNVTRNKLNEAIIDIVNNNAETYDAEAVIKFDNYANPLINDETASEELALISERVVGKENTVRNLTKSMSGDDFADFLNEAKGCYMYVGTADSTVPRTASAHHTNTFDIVEDSMLYAASIFVEYFKWYYGI